MTDEDAEDMWGGLAPLRMPLAPRPAPRPPINMGISLGFEIFESDFVRPLTDEEEENFHPIVEDMKKI